MRTDHPRGKKQFQELSEMCARVFVPAYESVRDLFDRDYTLDPAFKPQHSRVIRRKGRIVAHVGILEKTVRIGRAKFRMAGIGAVTCHKEFRGQDLPTHCMNDALAVAKQEGMPLTFLLCGITYYTRFGYAEVWPRRVLKLDAKGLKDLKHPLQVRPYKPSDAAALAGLYNAATASTTGSVIRDAARFHFGIQREDLLATSKNDPQGCVHVFSAKGEKTPRAYAVVRDGSFWEAACAPGDGEAAEAVLAWLRDRSGKEVALHYLSPMHPLWAFAQRFPHQTEGGMRWTHGGMGRILDVAAFLKELQPELEARINSEGIESEGHLHLIVDGKEHNLILGRAHHISLMISTHRHILSARVECTQQALLQLALGTLDWKSIPGVKASGDQALLRAVFPLSYPNLYRLDYF
ncbi:MAG: GNAT family N-acetyltransferase [Planctomycetes bacterium]|nr:GNAT family N-acetyltransferase [Planctomycetota bacterium]